MRVCKELNYENHDTPEWESTLKVEVPWVFSFFGINVQIEKKIQVDFFFITEKLSSINFKNGLTFFIEDFKFKLWSKE